MKLKSLTIGPPGNWRFTCPHCNVISTGITFGTLLGRVQQHYTNMNHPDSDLVTTVEESICASLSPADQVEYCKTGVRPRASVGFGEIVAFTTWLTAWLTGGAQLVTQEEANRRAAICATCPYNVPVSGCGVCRTSIGILRDKLMKVDPTPSDSTLNACGVCGCDLKTITHVPIETLQHRGLDYSKAPWCWQNDETKP
jgi:hypothetical protein